MKKIWRKIFCVVLATCVLLGCVMTTIAAEPFEKKFDVKPSDKAYSMIVSNARETFIYNKKPIDLSVGKRYYMVYTVDEISSNDITHNGVSITKDGNASYPYVEGTMKYALDSRLFELGATYFYRIEVTEKGLSYVVAKKSEHESKWIEFPLEESGTTEDCKFFGIWIGGLWSAKLSNVLCYDDKGNNLEIATHCHAGSCITYEDSILKEQNVGQWYDVSFDNAFDLAISNDRPTDSDTVYISYTVDTVKDNKSYQSGVGCTSVPKEQYPHSDGVLNYTFCDSSPLLEEGAKYLICAKKENGSITVLVRKTVDDKEEIFSFAIYEGEDVANTKFFYLWFGYDRDGVVTAKLKDFRFYDKNGNNLGVTANQDNINIRKYGDIEDYSLCEAVYWCEENNRTIILDDEKNLALKDESGTNETVWCKYSVRGTTLTMASSAGDVAYDYYYSFIQDTDGNQYDRLNDTKVTFVTGIKEHDGNKTVDVTAAEGYKVKEPEAPVVEGYTFDEWCLGDGSSFNFDRYVTESVTLYAKYLDGDGHEYLTVTDDVVIVPDYDAGHLTLAICAGIVLVTGVIVLIMTLKKGNKYD